MVATNIVSGPKPLRLRTSNSLRTPIQDRVAWNRFETDGFSLSRMALALDGCLRSATYQIHSFVKARSRRYALHTVTNPGTAFGRIRALLFPCMAQIGLPAETRQSDSTRSV